MVRKIALTLLSAALAAWCAAGGNHDAKTVLGNVSRAMGADNLKSIQYSGSGADFSLGQAMNPTSAWPRFTDKTYTRTIDFDKQASELQRVRVQGENPPRGGGGQPLVGEQNQNQVVIFNDNTPWVQRLDLILLPWGFLRAASAAPDTTVKSEKVNGKKFTVVSFMGQNKAPVSAFIDDQNMIERVETKIDNAVLGDTPYEGIYSGYRDFNGVKFPTSIVQKQGGYPVLELTVTDVRPNVEANIQPPQGRGRGGAGGPGGPGNQTAEAPTEKLGEGVYLILGGYAAVAVEFNNYIAVVEGPQSEQRALAIIQATKKLIPNKPIRYVVNTHNHFDHASGLRTFVAEGATVITHQINKPYYEKVWANPHTLVPDKMAQAKAKPKFETMTENKLLTDGNQVLELYHVQGSTHNDGMIMAYLPKEKVLIEADEFNPPAQVATAPPANINPYNANLAANIDRLKLDVDRIIPIHYPNDSRKVAKSELNMAIGKAN
ncbi:MAG: MBL fold metallo-hydrolase [Acidobacteriia bacterium]|nr:MBL fold metallo-hydrolase [Terriglobia bacterium]